jgi:hypothetical protein
MAISTYAELQTAAGNWLNRADLTARLPEFIALAEAQFNRRIRAPQNEATATQSASTAALTSPTDYAAPNRLYVTISGFKSRLHQVEPDELRECYDGRTGVPQVFAIIADTLTVGPTPDTSYSFTLDYVPFGPYAPDKPARSMTASFAPLLASIRCLTAIARSDNGRRSFPRFLRLQGAAPASRHRRASARSSRARPRALPGPDGRLHVDRHRLFAAGQWRWRFAQFGGLAIATNGADAMQKIDLADFTVSVLGGSPPKFEMLAVVKDFLVGGVMNGNIQALAWSAINNAEGWTFGTDQSDYQIMPSGGKITGILSGEFGVILQRSRICRMDYVGGNTIFEINEVSSNIGCVSVHTVAQWGRLGFFWSDQGPMMWDGSQIVPIGEEVITRTIQDALRQGRLAEHFDRDRPGQRRRHLGAAGPDDRL